MPPHYSHSAQSSIQSLDSANAALISKDGYFNLLLCLKGVLTDGVTATL